MATEFEDLKREVAETQAAVTAALDIATQAVALINDLRTQIVGGLTTEEAASLAASLDESQAQLAAKLAELSAAINPDTQVSSGTGSVTPQ